MNALVRLRLMSAVALALGICSCLAVPTEKSVANIAARDYSDPTQLAALLSERLEAYILVDVRSADEYKEGHIPTAINIPYDQIAAHPPTSNQAALVIVYCASGGRSAKAAAALKALDYARVVDFGAIGRWKGPLRKSTDPGTCPCR